ncbi:tetraspanin-1 [Clonorchis sinensis]|uniref:Tetraspanin-1 n=1 Tax=Clonorchis sinensis TaxID=79923 RepID=G7Y810_CLOSI|nr:tetraspanin-1 [Clonorchis sinensis]
MKACFVISKIALFVLNFLFVLIGLIILAQGIWVVVDSRSFFETLAFFSKMDSSVLELYADTEFVLAAGGVLIGIGTIMFLLNIIGCWGVVSEHRGLLITYSVFMSFIFVITILGIILLFALSGVWQAAVNSTVSQLFSANYVGTLGAHEVSAYDPFSLAIDAVMITFKCCGINGADDFSSSATAKAWILSGRKFKDLTGDAVALPAACCRYTNTSFFANQRYNEFLNYMENPNCPVKPPADFYNASCVSMIPVALEMNKVPIVVTTVLVLALELVCIGLAVFLVVVIKRWDDELYY